MATWVMQMIAATAYWGIVSLMVLDNVCPPIPSEVILPLAGFMVTQGQLALGGVILAGTLGVVLGALPLYYLGHRIGDERPQRLAERHGRWLTVSRDDLAQAQAWFARHGDLAVLLGRLVPGVRSRISIPAGISGMPLVPFLLYTTMGEDDAMHMLPGRCMRVLQRSTGGLERHVHLILPERGSISKTYNQSFARRSGRHAGFGRCHDAHVGLAEDVGRMGLRRHCAALVGLDRGV
jgi:membrane protein DedA with SNARE-associated domain